MNQSSLEIVVGLPGSGKTTYLQRMLAEDMVDVIYDDYQNGAPADDRSNPRKSPNFSALKNDLLRGQRVAIAEIRYCNATELKLLLHVLKEEFPQLHPKCTYFSADIEACKHNVLLRNRQDFIEQEPRYLYELRFIDKFRGEYLPPPNQSIPVIMG